MLLTEIVLRVYEARVSRPGGLQAVEVPGIHRQSAPEGVMAVNSTHYELGQYRPSPINITIPHNHFHNNQLVTTTPDILQNISCK